MGGSYSDRNYKGQVPGSIIHSNKFNQAVPARRIASIEFDQVTYYPPVYETEVLKPDGSIGPLYGAGFYDESGTWPCSEPGSQWLFNAPGISIDL